LSSRIDAQYGVSGLIERFRIDVGDGNSSATRMRKAFSNGSADALVESVHEDIPERMTEVHTSSSGSCDHSYAGKQSRE
jgi:hypothetical protein